MNANKNKEDGIVMLIIYECKEIKEVLCLQLSYIVHCFVYRKFFTMIMNFAIEFCNGKRILQIIFI